MNIINSANLEQSLLVTLLAVHSRINNWFHYTTCLEVNVFSVAGLCLLLDEYALMRKYKSIRVKGFKSDADAVGGFHVSRLMFW